MGRPVRFNRGKNNAETEFKRAALKWLRTIYGQHFFNLDIAGGGEPNGRYQRPGSPDTICSIRGQFVAIEFKAPVEVTARKYVVGFRQQEIIDEIRAAGGRAGIASNWEELQALVAGIEPVQQSFVLKTGRKI
jgi:hypothetical protein